LGIVQKTAKLDEMLTVKQDALASLEESIAAKQGKMDKIAQQLSKMEEQSQSRFANVDNVVEERRQELLRIEESIEQAERELEQKRSAIAKAGQGNVTSPVLPSRRSSGKTTGERERSKEMMVQEMREAIGEIAGAYGDIPFGFLFTNDPAMSRLIQSNFAVLEETVEVSGLLDSKRAELSRTKQQVGDVQAELDAKRKQLSNLEESVSKTQVALRQRQSELARLEAGIAPVRDAVEQLTEYFNAPKEASIRVLNTGSMSLSTSRHSGDSAESGERVAKQGKAALIPKETGREPRQRIYGGGN
jgi:peptidoglycan hydrolase CwlO-like protein